MLGTRDVGEVDIRCREVNIKLNKFLSEKSMGGDLVAFLKANLQ